MRNVWYFFLGLFCVLIGAESFKVFWCTMFHANRWNFTVDEGRCSCGVSWKRLAEREVRP